MDIPRYSFSKNTRDDLLELLRVSNELKNGDNCDLEEYERLKALFPLSKDLKQELTHRPKDRIDITQSDDGTEEYPVSYLQNDQTKANELAPLSNQNHSNANEIADCITGFLNSDSQIPSSVLKDLSSLSSEDLAKVLSLLGQNCNLEDTENFGHSLIKHSISNSAVISGFFEYVFFPKMDEFKYEVKTLFEILGKMYPAILQMEVVKQLNSPKDTDKRILLQYIGSLPNTLKANILRELISSIEKLQMDHITMIETLLNVHYEPDVLGKLVEIMAKSAEEFSSSNPYGKLLYNIVNVLQKDGFTLEQPLKHILGIHRGIWKVKIQKVVMPWFDDSLTQSFL